MALCTAISSVGLSACHDDSDDSNAPNNANGMVTLSGTAATGAALKNASVTANCNNNTGFSQPVSTDNNGQWSGQIIAANLPCALQAKTADLALHSYAVAAGNVNITPLTDLTIAKISRKRPTDWFKQYQVLLDTQLKTALAELNQQLASKNYSLPNQFNLFTTPFKIGDAFDQLLDTFMAAISASSLKTYSTLLDQVVASGSVASIPMAMPVTPPDSSRSCASKKLPVTSLSSITDYSGEYKDKGLTVFNLDTATGKIIAGSSTAMIKEVCGPNVQANGTNHVLVTDKGYVTLFKDTAGKYSAETADFGGFYGTKANTTPALCDSNGADDRLGFKNAPQDFCGFSKASSVAITSPDIYTFFNTDKTQNVKITVENKVVKSVQLEDNNYAWACGVGTLAACTGVTFDQRNASFVQFPFNSTVLTPINGTQKPLTVNGLLMHFGNSPATLTPNPTSSGSCKGNNNPLGCISITGNKAPATKFEFLGKADASTTPVKCSTQPVASITAKSTQLQYDAVKTANCFPVAGAEGGLLLVGSVDNAGKVQNNVIYRLAHYNQNLGLADMIEFRCADYSPTPSLTCAGMTVDAATRTIKFADVKLSLVANGGLTNENINFNGTLRY
ncbi:MAG: hypothetical protein EOO69_07160 [Moraxellaceae bacterium]|nr:MAG: hypothetical protein EOO69_07160 [Moraxellaceae bacterium]